MTPDELDAAIATIIIPHSKPRSKQNSHRRKEWENRKYWRLCTLGKSCKFGAYKQAFNDGKVHAEPTYRQLNFFKRLAGVYRFGRSITHCIEYSYHNKFLRLQANKRVRRYAGEVGNHSFYRKISEYAWECW